jgi:aminoglycoside 6'-N-acetyltransferase I
MRLLWPDLKGVQLPATVAGLKRYMNASSVGAILVAVVSASGDDRPVGFVSVSSRRWAEGTDVQPVGYVEGWYVRSGFRRQGVGRAMLRAAEAWAARRGFREMVSDTEIENRTSIAAHQASGYEVRSRIVYFARPLRPGRGN